MKPLTAKEVERYLKAYGYKLDRIRAAVIMSGSTMRSASRFPFRIMVTNLLSRGF